MPTQAPTKSGTARLSEVARHVVAPSGITSTGWPAVRDKCADLGITFDEWQHGAGRLILAKRADGKYAATIGGTALSIPRQVGKTFLVGAIVFALCLLNPGLTVIWTAHRLRTAGETFDKMQGMARRRKIKPHVAKVVLGSGEEEVRFLNGSRILFGARERGFGRGFDQVDVLIFDEAQILTENAIDDMVPATNQSQQTSGALMLFMGTPPKPTDPGEVFARMRAEALSGEDENTGYVELSAEPDFSPSVKPAPMTAEDWRQIARANPSYPKRTPREAILRMRKMLTPESMLREGYGIWGDEDAGPGLDFSRWKTLADSTAERGMSPVFGLSTAPDRSWAALAVAWRRPDGDMQVQLVENRQTTSWVRERTNELRRQWGGRVLTDHESRDLVDDPEVVPLSRAEASLDDAITAGTVRHACATTELIAALNTAIKGARWRKSGDGRVLDRRGSLDISPAVAAALALHGLTVAGPSAYESRGFTTL